MKFFAFRIFAFFIFAFVNSQLAWSAPCCSAGGSVPTFITSDERAQFSASLSDAHVIGTAPTHGPAIFKGVDNKDISRTLGLNAATLLSDRWQMGGGLSLLQHQVNDASEDSQSFTSGDVSLNAAYEALPEFDYNVWRPKIYTYSQIHFPTGKSIYETSIVSETSSKGLYSASLGVLAVKKWRRWDVSQNLQFDFYLPRKFEKQLDGQAESSDLGRVEVQQKPGMNSSVNLGYHISDWRLGSGVQLNYLDERTITTNNIVSTTSYQQVWAVNLSASYIVKENQSVQISYADQTLLGPARNTQLARTTTASYMYLLDR